MLSITDSGAIAARCGGSVVPTNSWLDPVATAGLEVAKEDTTLGVCATT